MVNSLAGSGSSAQSTGARTSINCSPSRNHTTNNINSKNNNHTNIHQTETILIDDADENTSHSNNNELALTSSTPSPLSPSSPSSSASSSLTLPAEESETFLIHSDKSALMPLFWRYRLSPMLSPRMDRLFVTADGSCAGGSFVRALADPSLGMSEVRDLRGPHVSAYIQKFRTQDIVGAVTLWSADQWCTMVPQGLIDELTTERPECTCAKGTPRSACVCSSSMPFGPAEQKALFISLCEQPTRAIGPIFFHIAAIIMKIGVLLLVQEPGYSSGAIRRVYDFGTSSYTRSMIVFYLRPKPKYSHTSDVGHYETVGLRSTIEHTHQTLFSPVDLFLTTLRNMIIDCSDELTVAHKHIWYIPHAAPELRDAALHLDSISHVLDLSSSTHQMNIPSKAVAGSSTNNRPARTHTVPKHLRDDTSHPEPVRRPLTNDLDKAARSTTSTVVPSALIPASRSAPAAATPIPVKNKSSAKKSKAVTVTAAPPLPVSDRHTTIGSRIVANVRRWVRCTSARHPVAPRVHFTNIPMWTLRCRTVLQALVAALRAEPMDVPTVVSHLGAFWSLPREVFAIPARSRGGKAGKRIRHHRIYHKLKDESLVQRVVQQVKTEFNSAYLDTDGWRALESVLGSQSDGHATTDTDSATTSESSAEETEDNYGDDSNNGSRNSDTKAVQRAQRMFEMGHSFRAVIWLISTYLKNEKIYAHFTQQKNAARLNNHPMPLK
jgi:hypothetical protein